MSKYLTLAEAKAHLRVEFDEEDNLIEGYIDSAFALIENLIERPLSEVEVEGRFPKDLKHAALLLIGNWYANREGYTMGNTRELPFGIASLIGIYKKY